MRSSIGTGLVLIAVGAILAFAVRPPGEVQKYVDVLDLGLILIWAGILLVAMQAWMHAPRRPRAMAAPRRGSTYDDPWHTADVHRPGYAGETQRLPTVRGSDRDR